MPPPKRKGPSLPVALLREIGAPEPQPHKPGRPRATPFSRKDRRKTERLERKHHYVGPTQALAGTKPGSSERPQRPAGPRPANVARGSVQKHGASRTPGEESRSSHRRQEAPKVDLEESGLDQSSDSDDGADSLTPMVSRTTRDKLAKDDAEIAALERKLGLKGRKSLPKSFQDEGLLDILGDLGGDQGEESNEQTKRKAEADEWLAKKRRKAVRDYGADSFGTDGRMREPPSGSEDELDPEGLASSGDTDDDADELSDLDGFSDDVDLEEGSDENDKTDEDIGFAGFDSDMDDDGAPGEVVRQRENPYVAPTTGTQAAKYVPPARRQETGTDAELVSRVRRQVQGLVNRLTDSNLVPILADIEKLYREYPRQHVTSALVDVLLVQICEPTALPDTLLVLVAGFTTAVYRAIGMDFGADMVQHAVERFGDYYNKARASAAAGDNASKETSNLITFLSELYNFQLIGCNIVFDYIRLLLSELSELNAELLLRVIRMSGPFLRQDDPLALKDIVSMIRPAVHKAGEDSISVRTKFMIETISDLKNNKMKAGASATAVVVEHRTRIKKLLGSLASRKLKATEPLRIGLKDIEESDKRGKWWLVGASWAGSADRTGAHGTAQEGVGSDDDESIILSGEDEALPDLTALAKEQMMNTDVRRSIFVAVMSATDCEDAYVRLMKLRLNKDRQREVANVLVQCAGAEQQYNPYYALIARRLCGDRKIRWALQDTLWRLFRRLGESIFGDDADEEDEDDDTLDMRRLVNVGKLYGSLMADGSLGLAILKCLNMAYLRPKSKALVEVLLITVLAGGQQAGEGAAPGADETRLEKMFMAVRDLPELSRGLQYFLRKVVRKSDLIGSKAEAKRVSSACGIAVATLEAALTAESG